MKTQAIFLALALTGTALGQGPLTPPPGADPSIGPVNALTPGGLPQPTMKTLHQVEPRTPISSLPFTISTGGSYYLTSSLTVASGDGITIAADNVTLDLGGFTLVSTDPANSGTAVLLSGAHHDVSIRNGHIVGGAARSGNVISGPGWKAGIWANTADFSNVTVSDVTVSGVKLWGIHLRFTDVFSSSTGASVRNCTLQTANVGINADEVARCVALDCTVNGIRARNVSDSRGFGFSGSGIDAEIVSHSSGESRGIGAGVHALVSASECVGVSVSAAGIQTGTASNCTGTSNSYAGIAATSATNCIGTCAGGMGIAAGRVENCKGTSDGSGDGINCSGTALNSDGVSASGRGLYAEFSADNCHGSSGGSATGLVTSIAHNCFGKSQTGFGLTFTKIGTSSWGERASPAATNYVLGNGLAGPVNLP